MSHSQDYEDKGATASYYEGFEAGVIAERNRIIKAFYTKDANRSIMEALAYPYSAQELEQTIMEGQDD